MRRQGRGGVGRRDQKESREIPNTLSRRTLGRSEGVNGTLGPGGHVSVTWGWDGEEFFIWQSWAVNGKFFRAEARNYPQRQLLTVAGVCCFVLLSQPWGHR